MRLDGDVRELDPCDLRRRVALVMQAPVMLPGSVRDNLAYGLEQVSEPALGGASPAEAARVQLTVLLVLLAVELVAALAIVRLVRSALTRPGERVVAPSAA